MTEKESQVSSRDILSRSRFTTINPFTSSKQTLEAERRPPAQPQSIMWRSLLALLTTSSLLSVHSLPQGETAKLSPKGQKVLDETTKWQESTGNGWDKLAAKALVTLVKDALKNGWPSEECTLEDVYVRKEW